MGVRAVPGHRFRGNGPPVVVAAGDDGMVYRGPIGYGPGATGPVGYPRAFREIGSGRRVIMGNKNKIQRLQKALNNKLAAARAAAAEDAAAALVAAAEASAAALLLKAAAEEAAARAREIKARAEKELARAQEKARAELRSRVRELARDHSMRAELPPALAREASRAIQSRAREAREDFLAAIRAAEEVHARAMEEARKLEEMAWDARKQASQAIQVLGFSSFEEARDWYLSRAELARHLARSREERANGGEQHPRREREGQETLPLSLAEARDRLMQARSRAQMTRMAFEVVRVNGQGGKKVPVLVVVDLGTGYRAQVPKALVDAIRQRQAGAEETALAWAEMALQKARKGQKRGQKARQSPGPGRNGRVPDTAMAAALARAGLIRGAGAQK